jgi:Rap1a immunity proteins
MRVAALVVAIGLLWPVSIRAEGFGYLKDGNRLFTDCSAPVGSQDRMGCIGYVTGITDALTLLQVVCTPDHSTVGQMLDVVLNQLRAHPEMRHLPAALQARLALQQAFPCR